MLSDEQRQWLNSAPYDGTTGNSVLARYASLYVGGHQLFTAEYMRGMYACFLLQIEGTRS